MNPYVWLLVSALLPLILVLAFRRTSRQSTKKSKSTVTKAAAPDPPIVKQKAKAPPTDVYSEEAALDLFSTYADEDNANLIGPTGFETLFEDAELSMEGAHQLIISWLFKPEKGVPEMLNIEKEAWMAGCKSLQYVYLQS